MAGDYRPFTIGDHWSRPWGTTWFRFSVDVPPALAGPQLEAVIDLGFHPDAAGFQSEGLVWIDGQAVQGIHPRRTGLPLPQIGPGPFTFFVEAASNPAFPGYRPSPLGSLATAGDNAAVPLAAGIDRSARRCGVRSAARCRRAAGLGQRTARRRGAAHPRDASTGGGVQRARSRSTSLRTAGAARRALRPALDLHARDGAHHVIAVGHAHIDSAWLWPIRETQRKCARTFASAVRLMDDYPDYHFTCSQAAQYDWIEQRHPSICSSASATRSLRVSGTRSAACGSSPT